MTITYLSQAKQVGGVKADISKENHKPIHKQNVTVSDVVSEGPSD